MRSLLASVLDQVDRYYPEIDTSELGAGRGPTSTPNGRKGVERDTAPIAK